MPVDVTNANLTANDLNAGVSGILSIGAGAATTSLRLGPKLVPFPAVATTKTAGAAWAGSCALDTSGTVTVATTAVTANSLIFVMRLTDGGTVGGLYTAKAADITAGTNFIIRSFVSSTAGAATAATTDTSTVAWLIIN